MATIRTDSPGFRGLLWAQALASFNDNAFKTFLALSAVASLPPGEAGRVIAATGALFVLPFIVFSTYAGAVADRWPKNRLLVGLKWVELGLMAAAIPALAARSLPALLAILFLMGVHSAFFSPAKLAALPELLEERELSLGNGLVQMTSFLGILLGTLAAGLFIDRLPGAPAAAGAFFAAAAAVGLWASLRIPDTPAVAASRPLRWNFAAQALEDLRAVRARDGVFQSIVGSAYFWFLGALLQMNLLVYGRDLMGLSPGLLSLFQLAVAGGIGAGSYLAGRLSRDRVELGLVPLGAIGLVVFTLDLAFAYAAPARAFADLLLLGLSAGCFAVPLQAFIQQRTPAEERGKALAAANTLSFVAILLASGWLWAFDAVFGLGPAQVFAAVAAMTLAVAVYLARMLPDLLLRLGFYLVSNAIYRIEVEGRDNLRLEGPVLLVSNHVSFVDAFLICGATQRLVRFLMFRRYYELPGLNWFFRAMGAIPISDGDTPKAMLRSFDAAREALAAGEAVCIFAEGEITRHGQMLRFKRGFERIAKGLDVPVVPVHLDRVWGSIFSFEGGRLLFKWPRRLPYPVTVSFGAPLPSTATAHEIRQAILELGVAAFRHRLAERPPLPVAFLREAKRHWTRFALADSFGTRVSYGMALAQAWVLGRALDRALPGNENAGLLVPPSVGGALANLGLALAGRVPINLNYTTSREVVLQCADKAGVGPILASRRLIEKLGWEDGGRFVYLEDVAAGLSRPAVAAAAAAFYVLPAWAAERLLPERARGSLERLATIIFTSGSTGIPKGVMLTHANIQANLESLAQVYNVNPGDRMLGALPFFHSFGYTGTLWFPLLCGFGVVYHPNPLDAKRIGDLVSEHAATFLMGTPTFLASYLRRVEPEKFRSLRCVVVGAEKLREELSAAFEERFKLAPLEGYGCTELSPVAAVNIPDVDLNGVRQRGRKTGSVGHAVPGVLARVVDPETGAPRPEGEPGLLLVKGPNVMKGYLGEPERTAEALRDGYYVTGDIAAIDADGFITITDRLSRFSKIAGEMVPHIRVEAKLHELAGRVEQTFVVAGVPDASRGERLLVLYKDFADVDGVWRRLQESDLPKLWIPDREAFRKVDEFPVLGSGKLDMQRLKAVARELAA